MQEENAKQRLDISGNMKEGDNMTREQTVKFLMTNPSKFAHMLGFTKLGEIHNKWIIDMIRGKEDETLEASRG